MKIKTSHDYPPIPTRDADWSAVTDDYDWAPDAKDHPIGRGRTEQDAINDLVEQLVTEAFEDGYMTAQRDAREIVAKQGTTNGDALAVCEQLMNPQNREVHSKMINGATWPLWGKPCAACGKPVHPPTNIYQKAAHVLSDRIWHGDCFPAGGAGGTFTLGGPPHGGGGGQQ